MARIASTVWIALLTALISAQAVMAQDTQSGGYPRGGVADDVEGRLSTAGSGGQLPFTGLNLVVLVVGGAVLIGLGALLLARGRSNRGPAV